MRFECDLRQHDRRLQLHLQQGLLWGRQDVRRYAWAIWDLYVSCAELVPLQASAPTSICVLEIQSMLLCRHVRACPQIFECEWKGLMLPPVSPKLLA